MLYIHYSSCISPQRTFTDITINELVKPAGNKLYAQEPTYQNIPPGVLRRMGKAVRMSVGAAMPLLGEGIRPNGFIVGTANGGMEDCIKFLNQIIQYEEGMLTPGNFVQSTPNALASQISLLTANTAYNITHVHRGLAFENAVIDAAMQVAEKPAGNYLIGGVDEISSYNYNIDELDGWYKKDPAHSEELYTTDSPGSVAGEGSAMFVVNGNGEGSIARIKGLKTLHTTREEAVTEGLREFLANYLPEGEKVDLLLSGENGDNRLLKYYHACEKVLKNDVAIARFKHMSGEYATASAFALWLGCRLLKEQEVPQHMMKKGGGNGPLRHILIVNNFKGLQHSFILLST